MEPPSVAISITGLIIQFVEIGKSAYELFETVQDFSGESKRLVVLVNVEKLRYDNWAKPWAHEISLYGDASKFEERHKGQYMNFTVAIDIIAQICDLLTNVNALREKYGLNDKFVSQSAILSFGAAVLSTPEEQEERARSYLKLQQRIGVTGRMKWAVRDKENCEKLMSHLGEYNEALRNILPPLRQKAYDGGLVTYLSNAHAESGEEALRILAHETKFTIGQEGRGLAAAARMKYDRFQFEKGKLNQPSTPTSDIVLQSDSFHLPCHDPTSRSLVKFGNETVIMELKEISHPSHDRR
ncbi:kinesin light chain [Fusarium acutatum]|uniref:Kinesin light chain n=1 Tax=Fusarium acutatum TaxID=78861 RepID=A0A8H4JJW4_9HYPO|nr:kinesin light chain [Fusarium acutatum]